MKNNSLNFVQCTLCTQLEWSSREKKTRPITARLTKNITRNTSKIWPAYESVRVSALLHKYGIWMIHSYWANTFHAKSELAHLTKMMHACGFDNLIFRFWACNTIRLVVHAKEWKNNGVDRETRLLKIYPAAQLYLHGRDTQLYLVDKFSSTHA